MRRTAALPLALALLGWSAHSFALGLGSLELRSGLGEPLRMRIAVTADSAEEVGCVQVKAHGDDIGVAPTVRAQVVSIGAGRFLDLTSTQPINDPALQLLVTAGCSGTISREYVLLLDPPPLVPAIREVSPAGVVVPGDARAPAASVRRGSPRAVLPKQADSENSAGRAPVEGAGQPLPPNNSESDAVPRPAAPQKARNQSRTLPTTPRPAQKDTPSLESGRSDALHVSPMEPGSAIPAGPRGNPAVASTAPSAPGVGPSPLSAPPGASNAKLPGSAATVAPDAGAPSVIPSLPLAPPPEAPSVASREQQLENQLKSLSVQVDQLREQMRTVTERNRELEARSSNAIFTWILGILALCALALAAWLAWSYRNLQRRNARSPWFEATQMRGPASSRPAAAVRTSAQARDDLLEDTDFTGTDGIEATEMSATDPFGQGLVASGASFKGPPTLADAQKTTIAHAPDPALQAAEAEALRSERYREALAAAIAPLGRDLAAPSVQTAASAAMTSERQRASQLEAILDLDLVKTEPHSSTQDESLPEVMTPLDFELPPLDITRSEFGRTLGSQRLTGLTATTLNASSSPAPPSDPGAVQFKLTQFASIAERAKEFQRSEGTAQAIALLREAVLREEHCPTILWLMLFELYRQADKQSLYEALAENFLARYKRAMVGWRETLSARTAQSALALNQDLDLRINSLWGSPAGIELLRELTCGVDQTDKITFNAELQRDLLLLAKVFPLDENP